jgi:hypothetical protein
MAKVLANNNDKLTFIPTMAVGTDYKLIDTDKAEIKLSVANAGTSKDLQDDISTEGFSLGATGETSITDTPLGNIGNEVSITGSAQYSGSFQWYLSNNAVASNNRSLYRRGTTGFLLRRIGEAATNNYANNDDVWLYAVTFGVQLVTLPAGGGFYKYTQAIKVNNAWEFSKVVTALTV